MAEQHAAVPPISPANMMAEALDKASQDLEKAVNACIDQLQSFNDDVEKSLINQLNKLLDQSKNYIEGNFDDMSTHREELIDRLMEFERSEIETMVSAARDVRQHVAARSQQASDSISRLVDEQVTELRALIENPETSFKDFSSTNARALQQNTGSGRDKISKNQTDCEQQLSTKAQDFEQAVQQIVADSKKGIEETLAKFNGDMEQKISNVLEQLSGVVTDTVKELEGGSKNGAERIQRSIEDGKARLSGSLLSWKTDCNGVRSDFDATLKADSDAADKTHGTKLEQKVSEVKDEINQISHDANAKITASHKLFHSSLKRLEKKYNDRLERLMTRFETALGEEAKLSVGGFQPNVELREQLHARLQDAGRDILRLFQRQVEQMESEYARLSSGSHERIDSLRSSTTESLDKHVRTMRSELDRISRIFKTELSDLNAELPKIEERGRAAAMAVYAYRSTMLSFSGD
jgi:DNA anti-recombination protein RmuC